MMSEFSFTFGKLKTLVDTMGDDFDGDEKIYLQDSTTGKQYDMQQFYMDDGKNFYFKIKAKQPELKIVKG
jgi:hypothetical protein